MIDPESQTWRFVAKSIEGRIEAHRTALESPHHTEVATAMLRGRIAELKYMLDLAAPKEPVKAAEKPRKGAALY